MIDPQIGGNIPNKQIRETIVLTHQEQDAAGDEKTQVAEQDQFGVFGLVQRTAGVEVVDTREESVLLTHPATLTLALMLIVASDVGQEIHGPATKLLGNQMVSSGNWGLLGKFVDLV